MDIYCSVCGTQHIDADYPKTCRGCGNTAWGNPTPVVVILQPVINISTGVTGLAIARRAIQPHLGGWAFMGGFVNNGENLEVAAQREWREETGFSVPCEHFEFIRSYTTPDNRVLAAFILPTIAWEKWARAQVCPENSEFGILHLGDDLERLCFPLHRELARYYLNWC